MQLYKDFILINEDYGLAKKILAKQGTDRNSKEFKEIEKLVKNQGWIGLFTKFRFIDGDSIEFLTDVYNKLLVLKPILNKLPRDVVDYATLPSEGENVETFTAEDLYDDLQKIEKEQVTKKLLDKFPSEQKNLARKITGLEELAIELNALEDKKDFISKVSRYHTTENLEKAIKAFIEASGKNSYGSMLSELKSAEDIKIIDTKKDKSILLQIKSYNSCNKHFGNTSWCIANSENMFNQYVNKNTKQFALIDFTKEIDDIYRIIGFTYNIKGTITHAHAKNDKSIVDEINNILKKIGYSKELLKFSEEEITIAINKNIESDSLDSLADAIIICYYNNRENEGSKYLDKYLNSVKGYNLKSISGSNIQDLLKELPFEQFKKIFDKIIELNSSEFTMHRKQFDFRSSEKNVILKILKNRGKDSAQYVYEKMPNLFKLKEFDWPVNGDISDMGTAKNIMSTLNEINKLDNYIDNIISDKPTDKESLHSLILAVSVALNSKNDVMLNKVMDYITSTDWKWTNVTHKRFYFGGEDSYNKKTQSKQSIPNYIIIRIGDTTDDTKDVIELYKKYENFFKLNNTQKSALLKRLDITPNSEEYKAIMGEKKLTPASVLTTYKNNEGFTDFYYKAIKDLTPSKQALALSKIIFVKGNNYVNRNAVKITFDLLKKINLTPEIATGILDLWSNNHYVEFATHQRGAPDNPSYKDLLVKLMEDDGDPSKLYDRWKNKPGYGSYIRGNYVTGIRDERQGFCDFLEEHTKVPIKVEEKEPEMAYDSYKYIKSFKQF